MKFFQVQSWKDVLKHLGVILGIFFLLLIIFFYIYMPSSTNHGETLTVPDLTGMSLESLDGFLGERNMRYEVNSDSSYSAEYPPFSVLKQYPKAGSKVKENRKIYLSLNAVNPPKVKMPKLVDGSLKNAQMVLQSYGLLLGEIRYVPHQFQNAVLEQQLKGNAIEEGAFLPKGSKIDLVVGDGLGSSFSISNVIGVNEEEAKFILVGSGLKIGKVLYEDSDNVPNGSVLRQFPPAGQSVKIGDLVELVIAQGEEGAADDIIGKELKETQDDE